MRFREFNEALFSFYTMPGTFAATMTACCELSHPYKRSSPTEHRAQALLAISTSCFAIASAIELFQSKRFKEKGILDPQNLAISAIALMHLGVCVDLSISHIHR